MGIMITNLKRGQVKAKPSGDHRRALLCGKEEFYEEFVLSYYCPIFFWILFRNSLFLSIPFTIPL